MKKLWKELAAAVLLAWGLPWLFGGLAAAFVPQRPMPELTQPPTTTEPAEHIRVIMDGQAVEMELDDYLTGVLLGELPANFHIQAKMAQAVVARTYTLRTIAVKQVHPGAVCTDSTCCQAYRDPAAYIASGGSPQAVESARQAVMDTGGQVLTYGGTLIDATYFSCSGGRTEDAVAVWGADIPYLQGVESPGEEDAAHYSDTVRFAPDAFRHAIGAALPGDPSGWFGAVRYTQGGGVDTMTIGGTVYAGTRLRTLLGLNSTAFRVRVTDGYIEITTLGHGHRVGMSQYGADAMARAGSSYREILQHYYTDTVLQNG